MSWPNHYGARQFSDETALDAIARELAEPEWSPDTIMRIDAIVRLTGRNAEPAVIQGTAVTDDRPTRPALAPGTRPAEPTS